MPASTADPLTPLWHRTAPDIGALDSGRPSHLAEKVQAADVLVIGAGVTGLSTAVHLAEAGARVVLVDRAAPGTGTTGSSNGQVIPGLQKPPEDLVAAYGRKRGERLVQFCGDAPQRLFELVARLGIDCHPERAGWIQASRSTLELKSLHQVAASWSERGAPTRPLDRTEVCRLLGTDAYAGGWLDERGGTIQPYAYARGLAAAALRLGVVVHGGIEVSDLERRGKRWCVRSSAGELSAAVVVLCSNTGTAGLEGVARLYLGRSFLSAYSVQLATSPLGRRQLETLLPLRHSCGDTGHLRLRYFRLDADNRFIIGGPGWLTAPDSAKAISFGLLAASARSMFPQLARTPFRFHWAARDSVTLDLLPHLYEPARGLFSAIGFNGRGLAIGTALGSVLAARALGESAASQPFPTTPRSAVPLNLPDAASFYLKVAGLRWRGR